FGSVRRSARRDLQAVSPCPGTAARNPDPKTVERDFAHIAAKGMNTSEPTTCHRAGCLTLPSGRAFTSWSGCKPSWAGSKIKDRASQHRTLHVRGGLDRRKPQG